MWTIKMRIHHRVVSHAWSVLLNIPEGHFSSTDFGGSPTGVMKSTSRNVLNVMRSAVLADIYRRLYVKNT